MKCTQCKSEMENVQFDIGYGIEVDALHCQRCGFNITEDTKLSQALANLRGQMSKEVRLVRIGTGVGVRLTNDLVRNYHLKLGEKVILKPEADGIKMSVEA